MLEKLNNITNKTMQYYNQTHCKQHFENEKMLFPGM